MRCLNWCKRQAPRAILTGYWQSTAIGTAQFADIACQALACVASSGHSLLIQRLACSKIRRRSCDKLAASRHARNLHISSCKLATSQSATASVSLSIRHRLLVSRFYRLAAHPPSPSPIDDVCMATKPRCPECLLATESCSDTV